MSFEDQCNQASCLKSAELPGQPMSTSPPQSLIVRVSELEQALEAAAKAMQDIFNRMKRVETTLGL